MTALTIGDVTVTKVVELDRSSFEIGAMLPESTPERIAAQRDWMGPELLDPQTGVHKACIQSYVLRTPWHTVVIDTCVGNDKPRNGVPAWHMRRGTYLSDLAAAGVKPEDVDMVICTHLHVDHVGWNTRLEGGRWVPTFPRARYVIVREEFEFWKRESETGREEFGLIDDSVIPVVEAGVADLVASDHVIDDRLRLEPAPGHTPAHVCVRLTTPAGQAIFTGDMMHRPIQVAEPEWNSRFCDDAELARKTRRGFLERHADADVIVLAAHFPVAGRIVAPGGRTR
ncbi:MAG TPA: MBL fold metallo-hydrolase, partial [Methylomirabilota bacterium]|nr:MBL fold metallo-hydrolase [Methylomirabilota bacterium]